MEWAQKYSKHTISLHTTTINHNCHTLSVRQHKCCSLVRRVWECEGMQECEYYKPFPLISRLNVSSRLLNSICTVSCRTCFYSDVTVWSMTRGNTGTLWWSRRIPECDTMARRITHIPGRKLRSRQLLGGGRMSVRLNSVRLRCWPFKPAFHDADTDTNVFADILARIVARMSACRSAWHNNKFGKSLVSDVSARMSVSAS